MGDSYSLTKALERREECFLSSCLVAQGKKCGKCLKRCPVFSTPKAGLAEKGPSYVMEKIVDFLRNGTPSPELRMALLCAGGCSHTCSLSNCPAKINLGPLMGIVTAKIEESGWKMPSLCHKVDINWYNKERNYMLRALQTKNSETPWLKLKDMPAEPDKVDVAVYVSCLNHGLPHLVSETLDILKMMGVKAVAVGDQGLCCGFMFVHNGKGEEAQRNHDKLTATLSKFRPDKVISYCLGCSFFQNSQRSHGLPVPFEAQSVLEFLADNVDKLKFKKPLNKVITVSDSCMQPTWNDPWEKVRNLLRAIPGVTLAEMEHSKEKLVCCMTMPFMRYPEVMQDFPHKKAEDAIAAGADVLATTCPGCDWNLLHLEGQYPLEIHNIISLVAKAMGIHHENKLKRWLITKDVAKVIAEAKDNIEANGLSVMEVENRLPDYFRTTTGSY